MLRHNAGGGRETILSFEMGLGATALVPSGTEKSFRNCSLSLGNHPSQYTVELTVV